MKRGSEHLDEDGAYSRDSPISQALDQCWAAREHSCATRYVIDALLQDEQLPFVAVLGEPA